METFKTALNSGASHRWNAFKFQSKTAYALLFGIVSVVILLLCGGCGGGDSNNDAVTSVTTTGQFIDDYVQGLEYSCSSGTSGVTNSLGEYTCNAGDDVTFYLGAVPLGTVAAQGSFISPYNLFPGNEEAAINLARLLQSLDADGLLDNGVIVLNEALIALLPADTDFSSASFTDDIESVLPAPFALISAADAKAHLEDQIVLHGGVLPNRGVAPVADAGLDQGVIVGTPANLDASNSSDADGDDMTYRWRLIAYPSGSTSSFSDDAIFNPTFTADTEGDYTLQLEVNDGTYSAFDTVTITFSASNSRPVANAGPDRGVAPDTMVTLNGSGQDADGDDLSYHWVFVAWASLNRPILEFPDSATPRFVARDEGTYTLQLTVDDGTEESLPDEVNITCQVAVPDTPPVPAWSVLPATASAERAHDIAIDSAGNSYVTGYTNGALDGVPNPGTEHIFITKYDTDGVRQWTVLNGTADGTATQAQAIAVDNARDALYVTGFTYGELNGISKVGDSYTDIFISKYDLDGNFSWTVLIGAVGSDYSGDVAVDSAGNVYVTGRFNNVIFTSKYDPDGVHQWTVQPDANPGGTGNGIALDAENNVYVVGTANSDSDLDNNPSNGFSDIFITKYTTDGDRLWTRLLGTDNYEMGSAIAVVAGNVYITGHTYGDFPGGSNQGDRDIFIAKYDTDGARQWVEQLGTPLAEEGWGIALDSASNIYVAGYTAGALIGNEHQGQHDYFITKHDNDGQLLWALQDGGTSLDWFFDLAIDSADNIYAAGGITVPGQSTNIIIEKYGDNVISDDDGLYTVGGIVAPVGSIYEVFSLTNSNGDVLEINDIGEFVFPTGLPNGASYSVEADTSQFGAQSCDVTGGSNGDGTGIIAGADVTDISVTCTEE